MSRDTLYGVIRNVKDYFVEVHCPDAPAHLRTLFIRVGDFNGRNILIKLNANVTLVWQNIGSSGLWVPKEVQ